MANGFPDRLIFQHFPSTVFKKMCMMGGLEPLETERNQLKRFETDSLYIKIRAKIKQNSAPTINSFDINHLYLITSKLIYEREH